MNIIDNSKISKSQTGSVKPDNNKIAEGGMADVNSTARDEGIKNAEKAKALPITKDKLAEVTKSLNKSIGSFSTHVKFEYGDDIGGLYVNVIDTNTDSLIIRFPSEEAVRLSEHMKEIVGMMFDKKI